MNKKAQFEPARKTVFFMVMGVVIAMIVMVFAINLAVYKNNQTKLPSEVKSEIIALRFANSASCFALEQEISDDHFIVKEGIIDVEKFNQDRMNDCYLLDQEKGYKNFNFRIVLTDEEKELRSNNYYNNEKDELTIRKEVLVQKESGLFKDMLVIYVQEGFGR
jgi:hypothetical protein